MNPALATSGAIMTAFAREMFCCSQVMSGSLRKRDSVVSAAFTSFCCSFCASAAPLAAISSSAATVPARRVLRVFDMVRSIGIDDGRLARNVIISPARGARAGAAASSIRVKARRGVSSRRSAWLAQKLDPGIGDPHAVADAKPGRGGLANGGPAAIVELDADLVDHLRLSLFDLMTGVCAARRPDDRGYRSPRSAADETPQTAADQASHDQPGTAGALRLDHLVDGFNRADARRRRGLDHLISRLRATPGEERDARQARDRHGTAQKPLHR